MGIRGMMLTSYQHPAIIPPGQRRRPAADVAQPRRPRKGASWTSSQLITTRVVSTGISSWRPTSSPRARSARRRPRSCSSRSWTVARAHSCCPGGHQGRDHRGSCPTARRGHLAGQSRGHAQGHRRSMASYPRTVTLWRDACESQRIPTRLPLRLSAFTQATPAWPMPTHTGWRILRFAQPVIALCVWIRDHRVHCDLCMHTEGEEVASRYHVYHVYHVLGALHVCGWARATPSHEVRHRINEQCMPGARVSPSTR
jgi:hypothetical protein